MDVGMMILRLVVGATMAAHGAQKLFGWFGGPGISGTLGFVKQLRFRPVKAQALLGAGSEFGGGLLLALGLLTPLGAAAVIGTMVAAIASVHWPKGFFNSNGGFEFNLTLIAAALALAFAGPGLYSVDSALGLALRGGSWGLGALLLGVATAAGVLASRSPKQVQPVESVPDSRPSKAA